LARLLLGQAALGKNLADRCRQLGLDQHLKVEDRLNLAKKCGFLI